MACVCKGMWAALRVVAAAVLREEDRVGLCEFDVMVERGAEGCCGCDGVGSRGGKREVGWLGAERLTREDEAGLTIGGWAKEFSVHSECGVSVTIERLKGSSIRSGWARFCYKVAIL